MLQVFILLHKSDNFEPEHKEREDTNEGLSNLDEAESFKLNHLKNKYSKIKPGGTKLPFLNRLMQTDFPESEK